MDKQTISWTLDITFEQDEDGRWWAQSPYLNWVGDGATKRDALLDLLRLNSVDSDKRGGFFFCDSGVYKSSSIDEVADSLLPNDIEDVKGPERLLAFLPDETDNCPCVSCRKERGEEAPKEEKPEPKFKVGDRVYTNEGVWFIGTIEQQWWDKWENTHRYQVRCEDHIYPESIGTAYTRKESLLELVEEEPPTPEPEFKEGDYVRCSCEEEGTITLDEVYDGETFWRIGNTYGHPERELEHTLTPQEEWWERLTKLGA